MSPIDLERHRPPGQHRRGPICNYSKLNFKQGKAKRKSFDKMLENQL